MHKTIRTYTRHAVALVGCAVLTSHLAGQAQAADLVISAPNMPGQSETDGSGRDLDLVRAILDACGHDVAFEFMPFGRHFRRYETDAEVDGVMTVPAGMEMSGHGSEVYTHYQNGVSVLESSDLSIESLDDLDGLDLVTFENGINILGLEDRVERFGSVRELSKQVLHSRMLFRNRVDAVLSDGLIVAEINKRLQKDDDRRFDASQSVTFHAVFPPSPYEMAFRDAGIRDDFNRCREDLANDGTLDRINTRYVSRYRDTLGDDYLGY